MGFVVVPFANVRFTVPLFPFQLNANGTPDTTSQVSSVKARELAAAATTPTQANELKKSLMAKRALRSKIQNEGAMGRGRSWPRNMGRRSFKMLGPKQGKPQGSRAINQ